VLPQRARAENIFWGLAIACFAALIIFDLIIIPFSCAQLTSSAIVAVNSALGGSSGLLALLVAYIFPVYKKL
jgi:hypothetical protein